MHYARLIAKATPCNLALSSQSYSQDPITRTQSGTRKTLEKNTIQVKVKLGSQFECRRSQLKKKHFTTLTACFLIRLIGCLQFRKKKIKKNILVEWFTVSVEDEAQDFDHGYNSTKIRLLLR